MFCNSDDLPNLITNFGDDMQDLEDQCEVKNYSALPQSKPLEQNL